MITITTRTEHIGGQLERDGRIFPVKLDVTVKPFRVDEVAEPTKWEPIGIQLANHVTSPPDGNYLLRYILGGKQTKQLYRIENRGLLAGHM
jgi:hypothetical protein